MRLAVLVHAASSPTASVDASLLGSRLSAQDAAFSVISVAAHDDVALGLPRALEGTRSGGTILVYVGAAVTKGPTGAVEIVSGSRSVRFEEVRSAMAATSPAEALLIADVVHEGGHDDPVAVIDLASAIARAVAPDQSGVGLLLAVRRSMPDAEASPFLQLLWEKADEIGRGGKLSMEDLYAALREEPRVHEVTQALTFRGKSFNLLRGRPSSGFFAAAPDAADASLGEASRLFSEGKLDEALDAAKRVLLLAGSDAQKRAEVFFRIALIKQRQDRAAEALANAEKALAADPAHRGALELTFRSLFEAARWKDAEATGEKLLDVLLDEDDLHQVLSELATVWETKNEDLAADLLERARKLRPHDETVLERLVYLHDRARRLDALSDVLAEYADATTNPYEQATRLAAAGKVAAALSDRGRAISLYDRALSLRRDDPSLYVALAELLEEDKNDELALRARQRAVVYAGSHFDSYRAILRLARRLGREDLAFCSATVLEDAGEADIDEQLLADQHRPEGGVRPTRPLEPAWIDSLVAPATSPHVAAVLLAIADSAAEIQRDRLREAGRLASLDASLKQDPATSTVSAIRAYAFAGRLLGVELPDLYVVPEVAGGIAAAVGETVLCVVGRSILSGRTLPELSFLMARHLAYHRAGARVALFYPTPQEVMSLFVAAVQVARPEFAPSVPSAHLVAELREELDDRLSEEENDALERAVSAFETSGGRPDVMGWLRSLELTATRTGLLACGDVTVAAKLLRDDPAPPGDLPVPVKVEDLYAYAVSDAHGALRERLGVSVAAARPSQLPRM
jgi:tetratricopeptide (TPR) repeat protein